MKRFRCAAASALVLIVVWPAGAQTWRQDLQRSAPGQTWRCGEKTYCRQMTSCAEARFRLQTCGLARLDGDRDGVPCETLCGQSSRGGMTRRR